MRTLGRVGGERRPVRKAPADRITVYRGRRPGGANRQADRIDWGVYPRRALSAAVDADDDRDPGAGRRRTGDLGRFAGALDGNPGRLAVKLDAGTDKLGAAVKIGHTPDPQAAAPVAAQVHSQAASSS